MHLKTDGNVIGTFCLEVGMPSMIYYRMYYIIPYSVMIHYTILCYATSTIH